MFRRLLHPIEDAYISQFYANSNFGAVPFLYTNRYKGPGDEYQSLLKFDDDFFCHPGRRVHAQLRLKIYRNEAKHQLMHNGPAPSPPGRVQSLIALLLVLENKVCQLFQFIESKRGNR
jgi:hypothetical protein